MKTNAMSTAVVMHNQEGSIPVPVGMGPVIIQETTTPAPKSSIDEKYPTKMSIVTGALRVALVIVSIILEIVAVSQGSFLRISGYHTIWNGIFLAASGALGIAAGVKPIHPLVISHLVLSIVCCCIFSIVTIIIGAFNWAGDHLIETVDQNLAAAIMFIGLAHLVLNIWGSVLGCATCCSSPNQTTTTRTTYSLQSAAGQPQLAQNWPGYQPQQPGPQMPYSHGQGLPMGTGPPVEPSPPPPYEEMKPNALYGSDHGEYLTPTTSSNQEGEYEYTNLGNEYESVEDNTYTELRLSKMND